MQNSIFLFKKISLYAKLCRLHKPIGIFLLLWPTLIALWIAGNGHPEPKFVYIFILGVILMRSAGCIINDIFDQNFDANVSRTKHRPLVTNAVSTKEALLLFIFFLFLSLVLLFQLNRLSQYLAVVSLILAIIYPLMKRITHLPQIVLGLAFSMAIPMSFAAQLNQIPTVAWLIFLANLFWVTAYDSQYAMADRTDDIKIGIKSTAILFGQYDRFIILGLQLTSIMFFILLGLQLRLATPFNDNFHNAQPYFLGLLLAFIQIAYQFKLTYKRDPAQCLKAFLNNNLFGAGLFLGIFFSYY